MTTQPTVIEAKGGAMTISRSPSLTFVAQPATDDIILMFPADNASGTAITVPAGWTNILGGTADVQSDSHEMAVLYHRVTAAEAVSTKTYTLTNFYAINQNGDVTGCIVRGVDTVVPIGGVASLFDSGNTATPHIIAGVTPTVTNGLVIAGVAKDLTGAYTVTPTGWTQLAVSNNNQGRWMGRYNTATTAGTPIAATNITPSVGDEYISITVVLVPIGGAVPAAQMKVWNGSAWVDSTVKVYNGTAWVDAVAVKTWNGSAWVP